MIILFGKFVFLYGYSRLYGYQRHQSTRSCVNNVQVHYTVYFWSISQGLLVTSLWILCQNSSCSHYCTVSFLFNPTSDSIYLTEGNVFIFTDAHERLRDLCYRLFECRNLTQGFSIISFYAIHFWSISYGPLVICLRIQYSNSPFIHYFTQHSYTKRSFFF